MPCRIFFFSPMMCTISSLVVFFLRGNVFAQSAANSLLLHTQGRIGRPFSKPHRLLAALNSAASSETPASRFSSPLFCFLFSALRSTLRSLPIGELQSARVGGHHGDGGTAPGSHRRAVARGRRAARPVSQNGSSGRSGESGGCSQVGRCLGVMETQI